MLVALETACHARPPLEILEIDIRIASSEGGNSISTKALVDTGATFTVLPENLANQLGLKPIGEKVKVPTAKGPDELELAHALLEINGRKRIMPVLISKHVDRTLLGVITLEAMQLRVNPLTWELEEHPALLY